MGDCRGCKSESTYNGELHHCSLLPFLFAQSSLASTLNVMSVRWRLTSRNAMITLARSHS